MPLRLPGPWRSTCRAPASRASQAGGHCCGRQEAGRHADRPCRPGREHRHLADPDRGLTRGRDRVVAAATTLFGADTAGLSYSQRRHLGRRQRLRPARRAGRGGPGPTRPGTLRGGLHPGAAGGHPRPQGRHPLLTGSPSCCDPLASGGRCVSRSRSVVARSAPWICSPSSLELGMTARSAAHAYAGVVASLLGSAVAAHASSRLATQLQTALDSRVLIEQAKGVLMASRKSTPKRPSNGCAVRPGTPAGPCPRWPGRSSTACGAPRIIAGQQSPAAMRCWPRRAERLATLRSTCGRGFCRPRTAAGGGRPQVGLEFVEKLLTAMIWWVYGTEGDG